MKHIKAVRIEHFMGIDDALIEPGKVTIVQGQNGSGKSSTLDAVQAAFFPKGLKREPVQIGANEARVMLKLDDDTLITRVFKGGKSTVTVKTGDGDTKSSPQSFLDGLTGGGLNFNPVEFLSKKPSEQRELLLQALPIVVTQEDLMDWFERAFSVDTDKHGLEVLAEVAKVIYDERANANANVKALQAQVETMRGQVPMDFKAGDWEGVDTAGLTAQLQDIGRIEAEKRQRYDEANRHLNEADDLIRSANAKTDKVDEIAKQIAQLQERQQQLTAEATEQFEDAETKKKRYGDLFNEAEAIVVPDKAEIEAKLSAYSEAQGILRILETIKQSEAKLTTAEAEAKALSDLLELARKKPSELLNNADFPVAGLEITDDAITFNGLPIQSLSTSEKVNISLEIARALAKNLGFILVDGIECLDPDHLIEFLDQCEKDKYDYLISYAKSGEMEVTTDVGAVKEQIARQVVEKKTEISPEEAGQMTISLEDE
jgi:DNA repair exonuclease SbcCD ATPase subunit